MKKDLKTIQLQILPILKKADVVSSFIFGSYARGEETTQSDLDLLVEFSKRKSLLEFIHLKHQLEDELEMTVDIATPDAISRYIKKYVESDKIKIL